jgi:hypothetical protein
MDIAYDPEGDNEDLVEYLAGRLLERLAAGERGQGVEGIFGAGCVTDGKGE